MASLLLTIRNMYITMLPVILGGIFNMIFTKTAFYRSRRVPMDHGKTWRDGKRIFGDNKTFIGFFSMIFFTMLAQVLWGACCSWWNINGWNELYLFHSNTFVFNVLAGLLFGFAYAIFELPNSFLKRRVDIQPGKTNSGGIGAFFFVLDQIDSLLGVMLGLVFLSHISFWKYLAYILLGAVTHVSVNLVLYKLHIRKNL